MTEENNSWTWSNHVHALKRLFSTMLFASALTTTAIMFVSFSANAGDENDGDVGGGEGYGNWITDYDYFVSSCDELIVALENATAGDVIYIDDSSEIDLTDTLKLPASPENCEMLYRTETPHLEIKPGVTLASGRGRNGSPGALLYITENPKLPLFRVEGPDARITGLRLQGPVLSDDMNCKDAEDATGIRASGKLEWNVSWNGETTGTSIAHADTDTEYAIDLLRFGDFNGDGITDIFMANGSSWKVSWGGTTAWSSLGASSLLVGELAFGDFDGDGTTDVFRTDGNSFLVSWGAQGGWDELAESSFTLSDLRFGDFNGDGITDVFRATGNNWYVSYSGASAWTQLASSPHLIDELALGDFNGDGTTDVLRADGSNWYISWGGTSAWMQTVSSDYTVDELRFADLDGDGSTDVLRANGSNWYVSRGAQSGWTLLKSSSILLDDIAFGDFNGDGASDIFAVMAPNWELEVDNNEISGWAHNGLQVNRISGTHVHHNYFHDNYRRQVKEDENNDGTGCSTTYRLGYGVAVNVGAALIEANLFDENRHHIASSGMPDSSYEARYNLALHTKASHGFDMHGCLDPKKMDALICQEEPYVSGATINIHHNKFIQETKKAIVIRGIPEQYARIDNNTFSHSSWSSAVEQRHGMHGNISGVDNEYGYSERARFLSSNANSAWRFWKFTGNVGLNFLKVGDFDGDGAMDLFRATGSKWLYSKFGRKDWTFLRSSNLGASQLRFGDFDGNGVTDVFYHDGQDWYISWNGTSAFEQTVSTTIPLENLRFGDFNGDGKTDVFRATGASWRVSWGGQTGWKVIKQSTATVDKMAFGDFDDDGATDVFYANGSSWYIAWGGQSAWEKVNTSSYMVDDLWFCDFDGGGTDVIRMSGANWRIVSPGGSWRTWATDQPQLSDTVLADFTGDGTCDAIMLKQL